MERKRQEEKHTFAQKFLAFVYPEYEIGSHNPYPGDWDRLPEKGSTMYYKKLFFAVLLFIFALPMKMIYLVGWHFGDTSPLAYGPFDNGFLWFEVIFSQAINSIVVFTIMAIFC